MPGDSGGEFRKSSPGSSATREHSMRDVVLNFLMRFQMLLAREGGQDLVEYALLLCLISLSLISAINGIASAVNAAFSNISSSLA
jgi:Flp pilus assembly pilin Flp